MQKKIVQTKERLVTQEDVLTACKSVIEQSKEQMKQFIWSAENPVKINTYEGMWDTIFPYRFVTGIVTEGAEMFRDITEPQKRCQAIEFVVYDKHTNEFCNCFGYNEEGFGAGFFHTPQILRFLPYPAVNLTDIEPLNEWSMPIDDWKLGYKAGVRLRPSHTEQAEYRRTPAFKKVKSKK